MDNEALIEQKIIVYHGSKKKFDKFTLSKVGSNIGTNQFDINGLYMTPDKNFAIDYATGESVGEYIKGSKHQKFISPASDGYVYICTLTPKKVLIASSPEEYDNYRETPQLLDNCDLLIHKNIEYTDPSSGKIVNANGVEYVILSQDIITVNKIEHFSAKGDVVINEKKAE